MPVKPSPAVVLRPPVPVMRPRAVPSVPGPGGLPGGAQYSIKLDGFRAVAFRLESRVVLQSRSGRDLAPEFPEVTAALTEQLTPGAVLDGELCAYRDGRLAFQELLRSPAARDRDGVPVYFIAFDALATPGRDLRSLPLRERWDRLDELLPPGVPGAQRVLATTAYETALTWYRDMRTVGVEGVVAKALDSPYSTAAAWAWQKVRHSDTREAAVVGFTGTAVRARALVLVLPGDDAPVLSSPLTPPVRARAQRVLPPPDGRGVITAVGLGDVPYLTVPSGVFVEVRRLATRHATVSVVRFREPD
ncbi:putative DNA ligase-like protein [Streptomyces sp. YIM 130001]|uniref:ATP-dependent DNA ligase n=1 Tax=Streptomyces sp. YIM 130001 TaxID=2259644 RepID=UPI000EBAFDDA|nr:DNA ligase [Streptomyces sp. YIM 130001]RII15805.1 putative DNA ligase-like protein [Streptomyces sp. YIM 130001]